jgi:hypothetical protein
VSRDLGHRSAPGAEINANDVRLSLAAPGPLLAPSRRLALTKRESGVGG